MSDLTQILEGTATVEQVIEKEVATYTSNPILKALAAFLLPLYEPVLIKQLGVTSTAAQAIINAILTGVEGAPASA